MLSIRNSEGARLTWKLVIDLRTRSSVLLTTIPLTTIGLLYACEHFQLTILSTNMRIDNKHLRRKMKEIKFYNIFLNARVHLWSWNVPSLLSCFENVGPQYFLVGAELTQHFAFLSLEFSYPSDFVTIKTRVSETIVARQNKRIFVQSSFSRELFFL